MILIFIISFSSFGVFAYEFPTGLEVAENKFFSKDFDNNNKIILIGSSHVGQLNTTKIKEIVNLNQKPNYEIFNLAYNTDTPTRRTIFSDKIILIKPKIIVWGISYRDFQTNTDENPLPDPKYLLNNFFSENYHTDVTVKDRKSTRLNSSHVSESRMPSSA